MQTVYVDILLLTNFIVDYFLLRLTAALSKSAKKLWRLLLAAAAASLSSLLIFAPELPFIIELTAKLVFSALIVLVAFGFKNQIVFLKNVVIFYAANAVLAGGTLLLWSAFKIPNIVIRNGMVFYNISPLVLVLSTAVVYIVSLVVSKIISRRQKTQNGYSLTLHLNSKSVTLNGLADSGNLLCDAISGSSVVVCEYEKIKPLFSNEMQNILRHKNFEMGFYEDILGSGFADRFRIIPFDSLGESGVMMAFVLDFAVVSFNNRQEKIEDIIMAVTHKKIAGGEFDALINPELVTF